MRRRNFQVKIVKDPKPEPKEADTAPKINHYANATVMIERIGTAAAYLYGLKRGIDLIAQVAEHVIVTKIK